MLQTKSYGTIVTVTVPSDSSTDKRLDDLNRKVDAGFVRVEGDIRDLRAEMIGLRTDMKGEMNGLRTEMGELRTELKGDAGNLRAEMNARFEAVEGRFDSLQRTLIGGAVAVVVALIGSSAFG